MSSNYRYPRAFLDEKPGNGAADSSRSADDEGFFSV